jgi:predicted Rossmann-fold nucleotide-binding protein
VPNRLFYCPILLFVIFTGGITSGFAQTTDTAKSVKVSTVHPFFIISAGTVIKAYFNDKPLEVETISEFNDYVQRNAKILKDSRVVVTGKPKTGTYDEVLKTLSHYRIKNVEKNIPKD